MGAGRSSWFAVAIVTVVALSGLLSVGAPSTGAPPAAPSSPDALGPASIAHLGTISSGSASPAAAPRLAPSSISLPQFPPAWGSAHLPPGAPEPRAPAGASPQSYASTWLSGIPYVDGACFGRWSVGGQGAYAGGCYGHDEPALNPYSDLPGSGGNVTWNVSLPIDRSPTQNQSDLYTAVWFGMNLYDPFGYNGQCFLELQLYPDTNANYTQQSGVWSAFAVGWQIELATGFEDPCYAAPVNALGTRHPVVFTQGDHLNITMTGWVGSHKGENISIQDLTSGQRAYLTLFNHTGKYPLNPAYRTNNIDDSLPWSPGGDLPVSFAFEAGHTYVGPSNNLFGGCSAGVPPPTTLYPSTPCPSYDPQSWANDTLVPWHFYPTVFFNAHSRQTAAQVGFIQDFGGQSWIDPLSQGSCLGSDGSAWCTYPWYSYLGGLHAFTFGAVDYLGTTQDFGKFNEYATQLEGDSSGLPYFPVTNFTVPATPGATLTLTIKGSGSVYFLNQVYKGAGTTTRFSIANLSSGAYSVNAVAATGSFFSSFAGSGGVSVDASSTSWSSLRISSAGTLAVTFASHARASVSVKFTDTPNVGTVAVDAGFIFPILATYPTLPAVFSGIKVAPTSTTVASGTALSLVPGMYSLQAYPKSGEIFSGWAATKGIYLFTPESNYTWANVTAAGTISAKFTATTATATVTLTSVPAQGGSVVFGGTTYPSGSVVTVPVGSYSLSSSPSSGYTFDTWSTLGSATMTNFSGSSVVELQTGESYVDVLYSSTPMLRFMNIGGGAILLNGVNVSGQLVPLAQVVNTTYSLVAAPYKTREFVYWNVSPVSNLWMQGPMNSYAHVFTVLANITVNGSGQVIAFFAPYPPPLTLPDPWHIDFTPTSGTIVWNGIYPFSSNATADHLTSGVYALSEIAPPGETFVGWTATGVTISTREYVNALGEYYPIYTVKVAANGTISAAFTTTTYPVTFVDVPSSTGTVATITGPGGTTVVPAGATARLAAGTYSVALSGGAISAASWAATSNLTFKGSTSGLTTTIVVGGSGTLIALAVSVPTVSASANPTITGPNRTTTVTVTVSGGTSGFVISVLPDPTVPAGALGCTPSTTSTFSSTLSAVCVATSSGTYTIDIRVVDELGNVATTTVSVQFT